MAEVLQFPQFASDRLARLQASLAAKGLPIAGTSGEVKKMGADVSYAYNGSILTITVKHAPFLHRLGDFASQLRQFIETQQ